MVSRVRRLACPHAQQEAISSTGNARNAPQEHIARNLAVLCALDVLSTRSPPLAQRGVHHVNLAMDVKRVHLLVNVDPSLAPLARFAFSANVLLARKTLMPRTEYVYNAHTERHLLLAPRHATDFDLSFCVVN